MKLIFGLLLIIASSLICSVSSQYMNFKGSYASKACTGKSMGIGYVFSDDYCMASDNQSYLFNMSNSLDTGFIYEFVEGMGCVGEAFGNVEKIEQSCSITPQFLNSTVNNQYSQVSFSYEPDYEVNSVVIAHFDNLRCMDLDYAVTYSNGYTFTDDEGSTTTYTCVKNVPYIKQCVNNSKCTTKNVSTNCDEFGRAIFCGSN